MTPKENLIYHINFALDMTDESGACELTLERKHLLILRELIEENEQLKECYCNRTDCGGRIRDSKQYDSLQQRVDKASNLLKDYFVSMDYTACEYKYVNEVLGRLDRILNNTEYENEIDLTTLLEEGE